MNSLSTDIQKLEELFNIFNKKLFDGELEKPIIAVSPNEKYYGWFTTWKAWENREGKGHYEINICSDHLNRDFKEICGTLIHEMVHLYCNQNDIKDTSNKGVYHNKRYKECAESHGLTVEKSKYGWNVTALNEEMEKFISELDIKEFEFYRKSETKKKKANNSIKYVCPDCGSIVRSTKPVYLICKTCNTEYERSE